jgi:hypothetical protein
MDARVKPAHDDTEEPQDTWTTSFAQPDSRGRDSAMTENNKKRT